MKNSCESLFEQMMIEKVLHTFIPQYDMIAVTIEETKYLSSLKMKELQRTMETRELRKGQRETQKNVE